jgi:hypothetical protein
MQDDEIESLRGLDLAISEPERVLICTLEIAVATLYKYTISG